MSKNLLFISILFLLTLITLHNTTAKPVNQPTSAIVSTVGSNSDAFIYLSKYGYNPCENENESKMNNEKPVLCQSNLESMLKDFQRKYKLPVTGKLDEETLNLINTPRCGITDHRLAFKLVDPWPKKSFTWKLTNENLPSFGETKTREQLRESFNDWAKYAPITFKEVSQNEKADFDLAFMGNTNGGDFDGPGGTLAYAYFPTVGKIRFDAAEPWTQTYDGNGINLRLVGSHELGHALGLHHSDDQSSIMMPYYQLIQPKDLLSKDDRNGIQALYGVKAPSECDGCFNFDKREKWDYHGNDLGPPTSQTTYADCCAQCSKDYKCNAFTWTHDSKQCWLKSSIGNGGKYNSITTTARRLGTAIALKSMSNGKFVTAEHAGNSPLIARADVIKEWERFELIRLGGVQIALKAFVNNMYVAAENAGASPLIANRPHIALWETFEMLSSDGVKARFRSMANNRFVCAESQGNESLIASREASGLWEEFDIHKL